MWNIWGICKSNIVQIQFPFSPLILQYASSIKQQLLYIWEIHFWWVTGERLSEETSGFNWGALPPPVDPWPVHPQHTESLLKGLSQPGELSPSWQEVLVGALGPSSYPCGGKKRLPRLWMTVSKTPNKGSKTTEPSTLSGIPAPSWCLCPFVLYNRITRWGVLCVSIEVFLFGGGWLENCKH